MYTCKTIGVASSQVNTLHIPEGQFIKEIYVRQRKMEGDRVVWWDAIWVSAMPVKPFIS
jgi:hypothetical protein